MIRLPNNYAITADEHSYMLCRTRTAGPNVKPPRMPGDEYTVPVSWHASVSGCVRACIRLVQREAVADGSVTTLTDAARLFEALERQITGYAFPGERGGDIQ